MAPESQRVVLVGSVYQPVPIGPSARYFGVSEGCVRQEMTDLCLARGPIQKEPERGNQLDMDLSPGSLTSLG